MPWPATFAAFWRRRIPPCIVLSRPNTPWYASSLRPCLTKFCIRHHIVNITGRGTSAARPSLSRALGLVVVLLLASCDKPGVTLSYRFDDGRVTNYRWTIEAVTRIESGADPEVHRLTLALDAVSTVVSRAEDGNAALVEWEITTTRRVEDGVEVRSDGPTFNLTLQVEPDGSVVQTSPAAPSATGFEVERLMSEAYPPLWKGEISIGDGWDAPVQVALERTKIDLSGKGRLLGFDLADRRRLARIEMERSGQITSVQTVDQVQLSILGTTRSTTGAMIDADRGVLFSAESKTTSTFEIGAGSEARAGTRRISVRSKVELAS